VSWGARGLFGCGADFDHDAAGWDAVKAVGGWAAALDDSGSRGFKACGEDGGVALVDFFTRRDEEAGVEGGGVVVACGEMLVVHEEHLEAFVVDERGELAVAEGADLTKSEGRGEEAAECRDV